MSHSSVILRASLLAVLVAAAAPGCSKFRKGERLYSKTGEARSLEVPPDLDTTSAAPGVTASSSAGATASGTQQAAAQSQLGFAVGGTRDEVFARVGAALEKMQGTTINSRAQLLGAYDVTYAGANFLVRVTAGNNGTFVSAVDPRGLPATGDAPRRAVEALRASLGR